ncbi:hypothetical protein [Bacillus salipaludis]|uniref:Uncharacterized protein n=1 Tax=Bacillus salipaludis TaxID=2547811 RepID=A0AA90QPM8_9BACI|nr:hypothetical protein [Bacillus salipaludis]MDQ6597295.1 hypothetical protein [Bacillus salipaludis]
MFFIKTMKAKRAVKLSWNVVHKDDEDQNVLKRNGNVLQRSVNTLNNQKAHDI